MGDRLSLWGRPKTAQQMMHTGEILEQRPCARGPLHRLQGPLRPHLHPVYQFRALLSRAGRQLLRQDSYTEPWGARPGARPWRCSQCEFTPFPPHHSPEGGSLRSEKVHKRLKVLRST